MNDIFTAIIDKRLIQAVEYVRGRGGTRAEDIWQNVARYMNGITPEQCSERYEFLITEKQYTPLDYRPKVAIPDDELQVTVFDNDKKQSMYIPRNILVNNMAYFRNILSNKEESIVDLSIHSDICIFNWLIQYCYHLYNPTEYPQATLTVRIVFPVLVSAHFLGMDNLVRDCLIFMLKGTNFNQILTLGYDFSCMEIDLLKKLLELAPLPILMRYVGQCHSNYLIVKLANASAHSLLHKYSGKVFVCERCGYFCLQDVLSSTAMAKTYPKSTFLNCRKGSSQIDGRGRMISYHEFRGCARLSKVIQKHLALLKLYTKLTSVQVYWALFGIIFWCSCVNCEQLFPLREFNRCEAVPNHYTNHVIDKVIIAPTEGDLHLTIKESIFDLTKSVWNNLSCKSKLLNLLDAPAISDMVLLRHGDIQAKEPLIDPELLSSRTIVPGPIGKDGQMVPSASIIGESEDSDEDMAAYTSTKSHNTPPATAPASAKREIASGGYRNSVRFSKAPPQQKIGRSTVQSVTHAVRAKSQQIQPQQLQPQECSVKAPDTDYSVDSQDSNDCNELQTKIFSRIVDEEGSGTKGKASTKGLPDRYRRYLKLKSAMNEPQRRNVLTDIAHEEDVTKIRALNTALITGREKDVVKKARYAFESVPFPTYNFHLKGK